MNAANKLWSNKRLEEKENRIEELEQRVKELEKKCAPTTKLTVRDIMAITPQKEF